jgi:sporulation protein YlmC with PRC-barrel domain
MKLADLKQDNHNANKGTKRGREAVTSSLKQFGAGRSVLIDRDGNIIAGNKTAEQASAAGIEDVVIIQTDGSKLVAVQRTDLSIDDLKARGLAVADNRTAELGLEWDADVLKELSVDLNLEPYFSAAELAGLTPSYSHETGADEKPEGHYKEQYGVIVICADEAEQRKIYERLTGQGHKCKVVVT